MVSWFPRRIADTLKDNNIIATYTSSNKFINKLSNVKQSKNDLKASGVYSIKCADCNTVYLYWTNR